MHNRCAYCYGKFGLVRHQRGIRAFCSAKCVEAHRECLKQMPRPTSWYECLLASARVNTPAIKQLNS